MSEELIEFYAYLFWTTDEEYEKLKKVFNTIMQGQEVNDLTGFTPITPNEDDVKKERFFTCRTTREGAIWLKTELMKASPLVPIVLARGKCMEEAVEEAKKSKIAQQGERPTSTIKKPDNFG
jgi:hypothetical protein